MSPVARELLLESAVLPLLTAALATFAARLVPARMRPCMAGLAIVLGFAVSYVAIRGWPAVWPQSATGKLLPIAVVALMIGAAHQRWSRFRRVPPWLIYAAAFALIVLWLARPRLGDAPQPFLIQAGAVWLAGMLGIAASGTVGGTPYRQGAMLAAIAIGFAGPALFGGTVSLAALLAALGAALLGALAASTGAGLGRPTTCALLPASALLLGLGAILVMFSEAHPALLALAWLALFAHRASRLIARPGRRERRMFALLCILPPAGAVGLARILFGPLSGL